MPGPGVVGFTLARLRVGLRVEGSCKEPRTRAEVIWSSSLFKLRPHRGRWQAWAQPGPAQPRVAAEAPTWHP